MTCFFDRIACESPSSRKMNTVISFLPLRPCLELQVNLKQNSLVRRRNGPDKTIGRVSC